MDIIDYKVEQIAEPNFMKRIELAGRTCYKSENKITEDSAERFCKMLLERGHTSPFEHARLLIPLDVVADKLSNRSCIPYGCMDRMKSVDTDFYSVNVRDLIALGCSLEELKHYENAYDYSTFRFTIPIAMSRELNRHRVLSVSEQSTRYCNFRKTGVIFTEPKCFPLDNEDLEFLRMCEEYYNKKIQRNYTPQEARMFLPLCTKTEVVLTGLNEHWKEVYKLRSSSGADPEMRAIMKLLKKEAPDVFC